MSMTTGQRLFLFAAPGLILCVAWVGFPKLVGNYVRATGPDQSSAASVESRRGHALYQTHCAYCHGPDGKGDGPADLEPKARYFGLERFKFVTTKNMIPTDEDLLAVLNRGIPGSAMPSFETLKDDEKQALIAHVRTLARAGLSARIAKRLADDYDPGEHHALVAKQCEPGEKVALPTEFVPATPESIANGKKLYALRCSQCHGATGKGDGQQEIRTEEDRPIRPRDLTLGIYRGGGTPQDLYARIVLGIGGRPMPTNADLPSKDIQDLVNYVLSMKVEDPKPKDTPK